MSNITQFPDQKKKKKLILRILLTLLFALVYFYMELPALNFKNTGLYFYLLAILAVFALLTRWFNRKSGKPKEINPQNPYEVNVEDLRLELKKFRPWLIAAAIPLSVLILGGIFSSPLFHAPAYSSLIPTSEGDFASEIDEISFDQIPMLDQTSANTLSIRKLGELSDLVSQFTVNNESFQINYQGKPVRVTYLNYGSFFKWLNNFRNGIPAYMVIDMVTQEVSVARLENGIRYSPSEYFFRNLYRSLRFRYPAKMFADVNLEIDEDGNPWWIASVLDKTIGLFGGDDCIGAVLLNAVTGESRYYSSSEVPTWVDRVYTDELIIRQYDYYGAYHNGFWNSIFAQSGCVMTTDGSNYIAMDDDVWVYTGVTSVSTDESNIGFILVNQRTKEARFYPIAGAEEYSAASSAEGAVQQFKYRSTFPLLLNISGQPTYFMALKDSSSLVKMYAMVNVQQYQIVATGNTVADCESTYIALLSRNNISVTGASAIEEQYETHTGVIADIRYAVVEGNTIAYIRLEGERVYYAISAASENLVVLLNIGDRVTITAADSDGEIIYASSIIRA